MNILELPTEVQENILSNVDKETRLQLVCKLWNEICKKKYVSKMRPICLCDTKFIFKCPTTMHKCICNLGTYSTIHCKARVHPCVCLMAATSAFNCKFR